MAIPSGYLRSVRERRGFSQEDMAAELNISRPTYLLIEKGERELTISEAEKLATIYGCSLENLLNGGIEDVRVLLPPEAKKQGKKPEMRISAPQRNIAKFKEVFLYILKKVGAKPNIGETVLYKLLYFIDFDFYEKFEEQLMGLQYKKNHHGPSPVGFGDIVEQMEKKNELLRIRSKYFRYDQKKYIPMREPDLSKFSALELQHIDEVLGRLSDMNATQIREYSHGDIPWKVRKTGETLDYEMVFYRADPYSVRSYDDDPL